MIIVLENNYTEADFARLKTYIENSSVEWKTIDSQEIKLIKVCANAYLLDVRAIESFSAVKIAVRITPSAPLVSLEQGNAIRKPVSVGEYEIGGGDLTIIAGPCSVETRTAYFTTVESVVKAGANILRGGAFKPRTSPYSFQGLGRKGLEILKDASREFHRPVVTEVLEPAQIEATCELVDAIQVGMRSMRNFPLLKVAGEIDKPVILKRATDATIDEWMLSAEYILKGGNEKVVLCERGVTSPVPESSVILDLKGALLVKKRTGLPVIIDPSHGSGIRSIVPAMARAAVAAGFDGVMVEVHHDPLHALSDGFQSLSTEVFEGLVKELRSIHSLAKEFDL